MDNNIDDSEVAAGPRLLACVADIETGQAARDLAAAQGWRNPVILDGGLGSAQSYIEKSAPPNLLIVDIDDSADPAKALAAVAEFCPPETSVIAIGSRNELTLYRELLDLGVTDYLTKPVSLAILERALRQEKRPGGGVGPRQQAQLVAFTGARGGVGSTTVAGSVAWCLAHLYQKRVALLDLDLYYGNLALSFDLVPAPGLREALEYPVRIDSRLLGSAMLQESPRLKVLTAEEPLIDQIHVAAGAIDSLLGALRTDYDFIVIDLPRTLSEEVRRVMTLANVVGLVTDLSLASARDTLRLSDFAKTLSPAARHVVVANNVGAKHRGEIARNEFEKVTAIHLDFAVPFEPTAALTTSSTGTVLSAACRHTKAAEALRDLAMSLAGYEQKKTEKKSVFSLPSLGNLTKLPKLSLGGSFSPRALLPGFFKKSA